MTNRKFMRVVKFLLAGVTLFCVSWMASVNEWHTGVLGRGRRRHEGGMSTMRTVVAYSEGKQAEMDRPTPVTCDRLPAFPRIPHIDRSWWGVPAEQSWQHVAGTRVALYAAYYDDRAPQRYVRILASFHGRNITTEETLYCQTRSRNAYEDSVEVVAAKPLEMWWRGWDNTASEVDTPLWLSCPLTGPLHEPSVVSVVKEPCDDPTNAFHLQPVRNINRRTFTICVKDMKFGSNIAQSVLEWIETNKILGVDLIDMYIDEVTKETERVLSYYRDKGYVRLFHVPFKYARDRSLWQRRRDHMITYNDCLYRNIQESEYVVPLDVDEIILPKIANTWPELLKRLNNHGWNKSQRSSIIVKNVFFFDFMQDINAYESSNTESVKSKVYNKSDDVRIKDSGNLDVGDIELIVDSNLSNEVIDISDNDIMIYEKYKNRCGIDLPTPKLVHNVVRSAVISPVGYYSKSWMLTKRVLTAFNHHPLMSIGGTWFDGWSAPFKEVQLNHYKEWCNSTVMGECERYGRRARIDRAALRLRLPLTRALAGAVCAEIKII